jgi:hypothetical protein
MNAFMMTLLAMMLSTASARTLKVGHSCSEDYQSPNYWGKCVDGKYRNVETNSVGREMGCNALIILVSKDAVGNKTLTIKTHMNDGEIVRDLFLSDSGYYTMALFQDTVNGPDADIEFYIDDIMVHTGNYQQNFCLYEAGAINSNDHESDFYEGSWGKDMPGHVIIGLRE